MLDVIARYRLRAFVVPLVCLPVEARDFDFHARHVATAPAAARKMCALDADEDGDLDLVIAGDQLTVLLNQGDGTMDPGGLYPVTAGHAGGLDAGDLNGDGHMDLVTLGVAGNTTSVTGWLGDGLGAYQEQPSFTWPQSTNGLALGDLDGDGHLDAALSISSGSDGGILTLAGNGLGRFDLGFNTSITGLCQGLDAADLDGDGDLDLTVTQWSLGRLLIYRNLGNGGFQAPTVYFNVDEGVSEVTAVDMNGDGPLDLVSLAIEGESVQVERNLGTGFFTNLDSHDVSGPPRKFFATDLDGDGDADVAVARYTDSKVWMFSNDGSGHLTYTGSAPLSLGVFHHDFVGGDFDGNGSTDLMVMSSHSVVLLVNGTLQASPFLLQTGHLVAGGSAHLRARNASPGATVLLLASTMGIGAGTYVPFFDVSTSLVAPRRVAPPSVASIDGEADFEFSLPPGTAGLSMWFQAMQYQGTTNVVQTKVY